MRFDGSSPANALTPVMLPLGLLGFETRPTAIGSVQEAPGVFRVGEIAVRDKNLFASILRQVDEQIGSGHLLFLRNARRGDACMHKTGNTQWKPDSAL